MSDLVKKLMDINHHLGARSRVEAAERIEELEHQLVRARARYHASCEEGVKVDSQLAEANSRNAEHAQTIAVMRVKLAAARAEIERLREIAEDATSDLRRYAHDETPERRLVSASCYEEALAASAQEPKPEPHHYSPDYMAMGDCKICGHVEDSPLHIGKRPTQQQDK